MNHKLCQNPGTGFLLSLLLLGFGLLTFLFYHPTEIKSQSIVINLALTRQLVGKLYTPKTGKTPYPVMMLWHGVNSTKEFMEPLGIELAREGIAALAFDSGGSGESYSRALSDTDNVADAQAVMDFIQAHPEQFDTTRIGIAGHSMGGKIALTLASEDNRYKVTVVWGMSGLATPIVPSNLLLGIGLYDDFHPPSLMREMLETATGKTIFEQQQSGDFAKGTARKLVISPTANHPGEPYDIYLIKQSVDWVKQSFGIPFSTKPLVVGWSIWGCFAIVLGGLAIGGFFAKQVVFQPRSRLGIPRLIIAIALLVLTLGMTGIINSLWASNAILFCEALLLVCNYVLRFPKKWIIVGRIVGLYSVLFMVVYTLITLFFSRAEILINPQYINSIPPFMLTAPIALAYSIYRPLRAILFPIYSYGLQPSYLLLIPLLPELIKPGIILTVLEQTLVRLIRWLRQPLHGKGFFFMSYRSLGLLGGLILVLVAILYQQIQVGLLSLDAAGIAVKVVTRGALLPGFIIILLLRQKWFQRWESRCFWENAESPF
jgi:dienelactone hydrolase